MSEIAAREGFGHKPSETMSFQTKVLCSYARLSREMEDELKEGTDEDGDKGTNNGTTKPKLWNWIQATDQTVDDVHNCIMAIVDPLLEIGLCHSELTVGRAIFPQCFQMMYIVWFDCVACSFRFICDLLLNDHDLLEAVRFSVV
ncbi:hypothetical protein AHF37_04459 [Paragonimus kellicotti]|nr:hypothetical protein AHF37_04459 [Paragonimus kellicotti]